MARLPIALPLAAGAWIFAALTAQAGDVPSPEDVLRAEARLPINSGIVRDYPGFYDSAPTDEELAWAGGFYLRWMNEGYTELLRSQPDVEYNTRWGCFSREVQVNEKVPGENKTVLVTRTEIDKRYVETFEAVTHRYSEDHEYRGRQVKIRVEWLLALADLQTKLEHSARPALHWTKESLINETGNVADAIEKSLLRGAHGAPWAGELAPQTGFSYIQLITSVRDFVKSATKEDPLATGTGTIDIRFRKDMMIGRMCDFLLLRALEGFEAREEALHGKAKKLLERASQGKLIPDSEARLKTYRQQ
jgi:hypothetical protein